MCRVRLRKRASGFSTRDSRSSTIHPLTQVKDLEFGFSLRIAMYQSQGRQETFEADVV